MDRILERKLYWQRKKRGGEKTERQTQRERDRDTQRKRDREEAGKRRDVREKRKEKRRKTRERDVLLKSWMWSIQICIPFPFISVIRYIVNCYLYLKGIIMKKWVSRKL